MEEQKYLYVVFEKTTLRTGKFIRRVTGFPYNHTGISVSPDIKPIYSFSRRYKDAPFYGGFVQESPLRLESNGKFAKIMISAVPLSEENFAAAKSRIEFLSENSEEYIYNMISAACFPFKKRVAIEKAYTCVEFVLSMLKEYSEIAVLKTKDFCSIRELYEILLPYKIYEGSAEKFLSGASWEKDSFSEKQSVFFYIRKTAGNNLKLVKRFIKTGK